MPSTTNVCANAATGPQHVAFESDGIAIEISEFAEDREGVWFKISLAGENASFGRYTYCIKPQASAEAKLDFVQAAMGWVQQWRDVGGSDMEFGWLRRLVWLLSVNGVDGEGPSAPVNIPLYVH